MSNWRINFGLGPLRYTRPVGGAKPRSRKSGPLGAVITLLVVGVVMYLCCWGGVAYLNSTTPPSP